MSSRHSARVPLTEIQSLLNSIDASPAHQSNTPLGFAIGLLVAQVRKGLSEGGVAPDVEWTRWEAVNPDPTNREGRTFQDLLKLQLQVVNQGLLGTGPPAPSVQVMDEALQTFRNLRNGVHRLRPMGPPPLPSRSISIAPNNPLYPIDLKHIQKGLNDIKQFYPNLKLQPTGAYHDFLPLDTESAVGQYLQTVGKYLHRVGKDGWEKWRVAVVGSRMAHPCSYQHLLEQQIHVIWTDLTEKNEASLTTDRFRNACKEFLDWQARLTHVDRIQRH